MNEDFYKKIVESTPNGYAYHQIILDAENKPIDFVFLDINPAFEKNYGTFERSSD